MLDLDKKQVSLVTHITLIAITKLLTYISSVEIYNIKKTHQDKTKLQSNSYPKKNLNWKPVVESTWDNLWCNTKNNTKNYGHIS